MEQRAWSKTDELRAKSWETNIRDQLMPLGVRGKAKLHAISELTDLGSTENHHRRGSRKNWQRAKSSGQSVKTSGVKSDVDIDKTRI